MIHVTVVWVFDHSSNIGAVNSSSSRESAKIASGLRWEWLTDDVLRLDVAEHCPGFSSDPKFPEISMSTSEAISVRRGSRIPSFLGGNLELLTMYY